MMNYPAPIDKPKANYSPPKNEDLPRKVQPVAFRVAAGIMSANLFLLIIGLFLGFIPNIISMLIDAGLVVGLFLLKSGARSFTLFRAYAGAIILPILAFAQQDVLTAVVTTIMQLAYSGSLVLILQGETRKWKIFTGIGIFTVIYCGLLVILYLFILLSKAFPF